MSQRNRIGDAGDESGSFEREDPCSDLTTQDRLIVFEALVAWAGPPADAARGTIDTPRERRAWELIDGIANDLGLPPDELLLQIDEEWSGPEREE